MNQSNLAVKEIISFDTLKTSAYASAKINLGDELDMDDLGALFAVNDYFQQRLGYSVFSSIEIAAIGDALEKHGIMYAEVQ
ncbi:hypothetical protein ICN30_10735 [Polynucleobacter sp. 31A-FELB]|uniref:hypothetical protein n=1 Tax=Polynucleobacter sp. 31A-FELB TaxID=2689096 RepID=UPI001C0E001E|nr:hypothetical protein [Polynucleobacter sp. 31A-FELB]MBU3588311.1 hypothetical protein [Polynucleobacter sp. 31A-FELB]